jgi:hypothetical protein
MRNLLTGTVAALGLMAAFVGSASADQWLHEAGPGVVISQGGNAPTVVATSDPFAYEQDADRPLHQGGAGTVVNQTDETADIASGEQYDYLQAANSSLRQDAQAADIARDEARETAPDQVQHAQDQYGQAMDQNSPSRTGG